MEIAEGTRPRILLVEDYKANILVAGTLLELLGYDHEVADNGAEAFKKIAENPGYFQLVLMDVQMPVLDGYAATKMIREHEIAHGYSRIPIIGVTAHVLTGDKDKCLNAGMDDYLGKPFNKDELQRKISEKIGQ